MKQWRERGEEKEKKERKKKRVDMSPLCIVGLDSPLMKWDTCHGWMKKKTICARNVSSHMVRVVLYDLTYLSFLKIFFGRFRSLSMLSRSYIFVFEITVIPMLFSFLIILYRFHFRWKKCDSESDGAFHWSFPTVFIPMPTYFHYLYYMIWYSME